MGPSCFRYQCGNACQRSRIGVLRHDQDAGSAICCRSMPRMTVRAGLAGGADGRARPGRPHVISDEQVDRIITATLEQAPPGGDTHWSTRSMARSAACPSRRCHDLAGLGTLSPTSSRPRSCPPARSSSRRSAMSWACIWPRWRTRWFCVDEKSQIRPWTGPPRACRCCPRPRPG
jgi:hypothetical protein